MESFLASRRSSAWHRKLVVRSVGLSKTLLRGLLSLCCWDAGFLTTKLAHSSIFVFFFE